MSTDKPDAIALLKADHRKVEDLFEQFGKARSDDRKAALAKEICTELVIHSMIEEEIFYPAFKSAVDNDLYDEAYVEHDGAKVLIAEILQAGPGDDFFDAKVTVLCEDIAHHVKEEERPSEGFFAQARASGKDMEALGDQLRARKEELKAQFAAKGVPAPMTRTFTGAKLEMGHPVA